MTAILPAPGKDYTDKDFDSLRARLIASIKSIPEFSDWTDFSVADLGTLLMEGFCFAGDVLGFNLDGASREAKWGTATQLRSILRLAKQIGYLPAGPKAATATETISAVGELAANVTIPAGTTVLTKDDAPIEFRTLGELTLTPSAPTGSVTVENSESHTESFEPVADPASEAAAFQVFKLAHAPFVDDGSIVVTTAAGAWTRVTHFLASKATDRHFTLEIDADGFAVLAFGEGTRAGEAPGVGAAPDGTITVAYKAGGGLMTIPPGSITELQGTFFDVLGNRVDLTATNAAKAAGGQDRESVARIKANGPASLRSTRSRTVAREDFEATARGASGVGRALMLTRLEDGAVDPNCGLLWVVPQPVPPSTQPAFLTPEIRAAIAAEFEKYPHAPSFYLQVMDPWYLDVSVSAKIYLQGSAKKNVVKKAIGKALTDFFALTTTDSQGNVIDNPNVDFGYYYQDGDGTPTGLLPYSDMFSLVEGIPGVRKIGGNPEDFLLSSAVTNKQGTTPLETNVHKDLTFGIRQFPRFVGITLVDGDTGETL